MSCPKSLAQPYDVERVRKDFPILSRRVHGCRAFSPTAPPPSQRLIQVIEAVDRYEKRSRTPTSNRGVHMFRSREATEAFEGVGATERAASSTQGAPTKEIIFTRGTTESINLVAQSHARASKSSAKATRSAESPRWSITRTSSRGSPSASRSAAR